MARLSIGTQNKKETTEERKKSKDGIEKSTADGRATLHMTRSADLPHDARPSEDDLEISMNTSFDVEAYVSVTAVNPNKTGGKKIRLDKVA